MIRHWVDAMGDENPVYVDDEAARANGFPGVVAPPTMLQAWIMRGYRSQPRGAWKAPQRCVGRALGPGTALRPPRRGRVHLGGGHQLRPGVRPAPRPRRPAHRARRSSSRCRPRSTPRSATATSSPPVSSSPTSTASRWPPCGSASCGSGPKHVAAQGRRRRCAPVRRSPTTSPSSSTVPARARCSSSAARSAACCAIPPRPACASCGSFEWDTVDLGGRGTVYSFVVVHHPQVAGVRLPPAHRRGRARGRHSSGGRPHRRRSRRRPHRHARDVEMVAVDDELTIPMFRPCRAPPSRETA